MTSPSCELHCDDSYAKWTMFASIPFARLSCNWIVFFSLFEKDINIIHETCADHRYTAVLISVSRRYFNFQQHTEGRTYA